MTSKRVPRANVPRSNKDMGTQTRRDKAASIKSDRRTVLRIGTYAQLLVNEKDIVARVASILNGGNLFLTHPFQCLTDLGVQLSSKLQAELIKDEPSLGALPLIAYKSLKEQNTAQPIQVRVHGLFKKRQ
jgi:hypothetical protein